MSGRESSEHLQTLFSFEILVEYVRIEKHTEVSEELALGVRLLDFPTLLIYQPRRSSGRIKLQEQDGNDECVEYVFNRGKSCFFKIHLNALRVHLSRTPLYAMVLDVTEDIPKFVGSSVISLADVVDRVSQDVTLRGLSTPSSHGERGLVYMSNLTGEKIGSVSLSYKLLSLGSSLHTHVRHRPGQRDAKVQHVQECMAETNQSTELSSPGCSSALDRFGVNINIQPNRPANAKVIMNENKDDSRSVNKEHVPKSQIPETPEDILEEDLSLFCPPHLYYTNSAEERSKTTEVAGFKLPNIDANAFTFEDSEDEAAENQVEGPSSPAIHQQVKEGASPSRSQQTTGLSPNVLGESLRQLPLLNALLVELSQLNGQNLEQPLSIHPHLAWIYRPASAELSAGHGNTKAHVRSLHLSKLPEPRNCSTPILRPISVKKKDKKEEEALVDINSSNKPSKKLVYGTTKTFNLRMKQISPTVKRRECMELIQNNTRSSVAKAKTKPKKITQSSKSISVINQSSSLRENIETMMASVTGGSASQETITLKQNNMHAKRHSKQDRDCQTISENLSLSEKDLRCIHIPTVNSDSVARNKDKTEHHSESNQSRSDPDRHREKTESSRSSRQSSSKSSFSDSGEEGNEEADYADDFNSLEPSDTFSPDHRNSPEPSRTKTPRSPVCPNFSNSDSDSEVVQKRAVLPVPIKAPSSPQRALRGTHIIRAKTQASALSFSSDDANGDGSSSLQSICSRKKVTKSIRLERTSGAESLVSSSGDKSESLKTSGPVREFSVNSVSSFGQQEAEELEDELGSLDFRKEYQHISELVTSKLPGYTM